MLVQQNPPVRIVGMICSQRDYEQRSLTVTIKLYDTAALVAHNRRRHEMTSVEIAGEKGDAADEGGFTIGQAFDMCLHLRRNYPDYNVSVRGKWRFRQVLSWQHTYWLCSPTAEGGYDSEHDSEELNSQDGSEGESSYRKVPEFEDLKEAPVREADIVFQVSQIAHINHAHQNIELFGLYDDAVGTQESPGPRIKKELGLLRMRKHVQASPPPSC